MTLYLKVYPTKSLPSETLDAKTMFGAFEQMKDLHTLCLRIKRLASRCKSLQHYLSSEGMRTIWRKFPQSLASKFKSVYDSIKQSGRQVMFNDFTDSLEQFICVNSNPMFRDEFACNHRAKVLRSNAADENISPFPRTFQSKGRCSLHPENSNHHITDCSLFFRTFLSRNVRSLLSSNIFATTASNRIEQNIVNLRLSALSAVVST